MSLLIEASGRRSVRTEVEVPGTPDEVWQKIATGPGISSWFVPTVFHEDGTIVSHFWPGLDAVTTLTERQPPHRFVVQGADLGPDAPPVATEWSVEAHSGGTCTVRVVHSLFTDSEEWDRELESFVGGWTWFFSVLQLSLTHFRGLPCTAFRVKSMVPGSVEDAWEALTAGLGLTSAVIGQRAAASDNVPPLAGLVTQLQTHGGGEPHGLQLLLDAPSPGIAALFAHTCGDSALLVIDFYLYGDEASASAARDAPAWHTWMNEHFPAEKAE